MQGNLWKISCSLSTLLKYWPSTIFFQIFLTTVFSEHQFSSSDQKVPVMLTFMYSKLPDNWQISDKQYLIFQKSKSYEILNTDIYTGEDLEFLIHVFYWFIQLDHEIYIKCKKTSNLIKVISNYNICSGIKSKQAKKSFAIQYQKLDFFRIPLFHFIKSLSTILFYVCF